MEEKRRKEETTEEMKIRLKVARIGYFLFAFFRSLSHCVFSFLFLHVIQRDTGTHTHKNPLTDTVSSDQKQMVGFSSSPAAIWTNVAMARLKLCVCSPGRSGLNYMLPLRKFSGIRPQLLYAHCDITVDRFTLWSISKILISATCKPREIIISWDRW